MEYVKYLFVGAVATHVAIDVSWWLGASTFGLLYLLCLEIDAIKRAVK